MSDSTSLLDLLSASQAQKEVTQNALSNSASPAMLFARRESTTSALTWGYYGGKALIGGVVTTIANGTIALTASQTNYIEVDNAGSVSSNTTGFTAGRYPLYVATTGAATVTSYTDQRILPDTINPRVSIAMTDAAKTLTQAQAAADIIELTGTLTASRNITMPLAPKQWTVANLTTGGSLVFIGATGTGVTVASGKRAIIYSDGTNVVRVSADT